MNDKNKNKNETAAATMESYVDAKGTVAYRMVARVALSSEQIKRLEDAIGVHNAGAHAPRAALFVAAPKSGAIDKVVAKCENADLSTGEAKALIDGSAVDHLIEARVAKAIHAATKNGACGFGAGAALDLWAKLRNAR